MGIPGVLMGYTHIHTWRWLDLNVLSRLAEVEEAYEGQRGWLSTLWMIPSEPRKNHHNDNKISDSDSGWRVSPFGDSRSCLTSIPASPQDPRGTQ
jgi:hypothetical protein